jgi:hypothetical protein
VTNIFVTVCTGRDPQECIRHRSLGRKIRIESISQEQAFNWEWKLFVDGGVKSSMAHFCIMQDDSVKNESGVA